ncbi:MAG: hypothetical protein IJ868_01940 [Prevotella sp.]|nr:hypothetical protein [Prevotella sp.]
MKRYIYTLCIIATTALGLTSCLKDSDKTDTTVYDETAITGFALATVNRYIHTTKSNGNDTIYKSALVVKDYPFSIDHYQRKIYNTDSLPADCDLKHVLVTVTTSTYTGTVLIKNALNDSLYLYSSTDSIDLSLPREFRAYNSNLERYRAYQVQVNIKQGSSSGLVWEKVAGTFTENTQVVNNGDGTFRLSADGGNTWSEERIGTEEDVTLMPISDFSHVSFPLSNTPGNTYHLLIGKMADNDLMYTVWRKVTGDHTTDWVCMLNPPITENYPGYLPLAAYTSLITLNNSILAIQNDGTIYESRDQGISWHKNTTYALPEGLSTTNLRATSDGQGYVWLYNLDNGEAWRGHYNK